jgi:hypothetical protein
MTQSRRLTPDEVRALLASQGDAARDVLAAMFPPSTDTSRMFAEVTRPAARAARAPLPFIPRPGIDEGQLAEFNDRFASKLAEPVSVDDARSMNFQTLEDWNGYVTSGAANFVLGKAVERPLKLKLHDPPNDMTFPLRPGEDPAVSPLRLGLFADFGNGLRASREVARRVIEQKYPYAFHLGDVYYDGNVEEFRSYFEEPLAPLLSHTELFMLSGNHEMYSKGVNFQKYLQHKAAQHPGLQRQNAELFRLRGHGVQIIGLDTMWCHWEGKLFRGNEPRLDAPTRALLEQWLTEGDPDGINILLTSNEPFSIESHKTTKMLEDLRPFVERGLIDLWFWGNVHHAALYDAWRVPGSAEHGFIGACIGHGGYPFYTQREPEVPKGVSCRWLEDKHRFWPYDGVRPDVGLNGLAELAISRGAAGWEVALTYRDWVGRDRARATIHKSRGMGPHLVAVAENLSPSLNGADWRDRPDATALVARGSNAPRSVRGVGGLRTPRSPAEAPAAPRDGVVSAAGARAVVEAEALWKKGIRESRPRSTDEIARDSGWNRFGDLRDAQGKVTDWCGMFVATALFRAGLTKTLRPGFWHTTNVEHYFTYHHEARVPRWAWDDAEGAWHDLRELHRARGDERGWIDRKAIAQADLTTLDVAPGDVALIDHEGDGKPNHIVLVERYDPTTGRLHTFEGNARGRAAAGIDAAGNMVEEDAASDAAVRVTRDLSDPKVRRKIYGVGRLSALDFAGLAYRASGRRPSQPPAAVRVRAARAAAIGRDGGAAAADEHVARDLPRGKWDLPPEPIPVWLDPAREVTEETGVRPAPRGPFVVAAMVACLALGCDAKQAAGVVANSINETGWGRSYRAYNCGGWKITARYVRDFKKARPGESPTWWRAPGNRGSGDPPWCYYRAFPSFEAYFAEWIEHFVPPATGPKPYPRYQRTGERFWAGEDWFPALVAVGYKGPVTQAKPARAIREHDLLALTALRMWAQSELAVAVDGEWGPASRAAMRTWQTAHGLAASGQLDDATLRALAGGEGGERGLEAPAVPVDAGHAAWALDGLRAGAGASRARGVKTPDALDAVEALLGALKEATPARRRRLAARVMRLLARDAER